MFRFLFPSISLSLREYAVCRLDEMCNSLQLSQSNASMAYREKSQPD